MKRDKRAMGELLGVNYYVLLLLAVALGTI